MPQSSPVNILNRFMYQSTKEHSVRTNRHKFQFLVELILQGASFVNRNVRCERVGILDVHIFDWFKVKLLYVKSRAVQGLQLPIDFFEIVAGGSIVLITGQNKQILCTGKCRVVETPEVKELRNLMRFKSRTLEVTLLNLHHQVICVLSWYI